MCCDQKFNRHNEIQSNNIFTFLHHFKISSITGNKFTVPTMLLASLIESDPIHGNCLVNNQHNIRIY